jgi:cell division septal protein FtsQ
VVGPTFPIREVAVAGTARLAPAEVRAAAALDGAPVFAASARTAEARLAALPAVRRARVRIELPDRAVVEIEERRPAIALSSPAGPLFADPEGMLFAVGSAANGLPLLRDETGRRASGERLDPALVSATLAIAAREPAYFGRAVEDIRLTSVYGLVATLAGGTEIRLGAPQQVELKLDAAREIVLSRAGKRLDYVDVRTRENPVYFPSS